MPAQAAISHDTNRDAREEDSNPPRLGRGIRGAVAPSYTTRSAICIAAGAANTRGSTEARDQFIEAPVAEQTTGIRLLSGTTQVQLLPGAIASPEAVQSALRGFRYALPRKAFLSTHRVCGPPVKRCELGAMPRGGAIRRATLAHGLRPAVFVSDVFA